MSRWQFKAKHMDAVVFFKMGKFYELFEMDAHVGVEHLGLQYMAGDQPHAGFPEKGYVALCVISEMSSPQGSLH